MNMAEWNTEKNKLQGKPLAAAGTFAFVSICAHSRFKHPFLSVSSAVFFSRSVRVCAAAILLPFGVQAAGNPALKISAQTLRGIPGEPLTIELSFESASAAPPRFMIPAVSNLVLNHVEKIPVQRTGAGTFIQKRIVHWQGLEAGTTIITNLIAEISGTRYIFPALEIIINPIPLPEMPDLTKIEE